jgi:hypothetical protein
MKSIVICRMVLGFVNPPIGEALASDPGDSFFGAHGVINPKLDAIVGAEIELGQVAI